MGTCDGDLQWLLVMETCHGDPAWVPLGAQVPIWSHNDHQSPSFPSMIYFPCMTKIILYVQLATFGSHKISENMGFFNKKPFEGPRFFVPERGGH